jgi:predicted Fe-S protein YdhL (DUF1289 family)
MAVVETPCIKICVMNAATRLCTGCGRTLEEIASWGSLDSPTRERVMAELPQRMQNAGLKPQRI